jgi:hypothetical protein
MTAEGIALWMLEQLERAGSLYQETAAREITERFGLPFTYDNENGNLAIRRDVLAAFRRLTAGYVVWEAEARCWRKREKEDSPPTKLLNE